MRKSNPPETLKDTAKRFPNSPGVYFWLGKPKGGKKEILYIGKAGSLKKRVSSYFTKKDDPRIAELVLEARSITYQETDTVLEALILEANLIKKHWPKYNVKDKDGRSFIYLVIPVKDEYPKPLIVRGRELQKYSPKNVKVFGPYQSYHLLRNALELVRKIFPYSTCKPNSGKPCFHYQIHLCPGTCIGAVTPKEYKKNIDDLVLFFAGEKKRLHARLSKEHPEKLDALKHVADVALLADNHSPVSGVFEPFQRIEGYDISHLSGKEPVGAMVVFENAERNPNEYRIFKIRASNADGRNYSDVDMLKEVLGRRLNHSEWHLPNIVFSDGGLAQARAVRSVIKLRGYDIPVVGLAKTGGHSASAHGEDKLVILGASKNVRDLILANKRILQQVRNEAHRFATAFNRKKRSKNSLPW
jgi:excinuclease ABC subunit C